jgi:hypothetical protein
MEKKNMAKDYLNRLLKVSFGAGAVVGGAYVWSRLKEKHGTEVRLERLEQILEKASKKEDTGEDK